jgi:hypothetical protein
MLEFVLSCPCLPACKEFVKRFTISLTAQQSSLHGHPNQKTWIILLWIMKGMQAVVGGAGNGTQKLLEAQNAVFGNVRELRRP